MFRWPMMMGFAVMGLFLVQDLFPDQALVTQASELVKQHIDEVPEQRWGDVISGVINHPGQHPELVSQLKNLFHDDWTNKLKMVSFHGTVNPEKILPAVLLYRIPQGLRGLLFVALIAASMSTFDSHVNKAASFFTKDFYQGLARPKASQRELVLASYAFSILLVVAGFALGYSSKNINQIWDWVNMGLGAGFAVPMILRLYWWRFNAGGVVTGMLVGIVAAFIQHALYPDLGPGSKFMVITAISVVGTIAGTYLTPPTNRKTLERFYRTTRPFGFWGPLKNTLNPKQREAVSREHFYDLLSTPFALTWQVTLFLLPMQAIIQDWRSFSITLPIFLVSLGGLYKFWYKQLPPPERPNFYPALEETLTEEERKTVLVEDQDSSG